MKSKPEPNWMNLQGRLRSGVKKQQLKRLRQESMPGLTRAHYDSEDISVPVSRA